MRSGAELEARVRRLEQALERSERLAGRWKGAGLAAAALLAGAVGLAAVRQEPAQPERFDALQAKRIEVLDAQGGLAIALGTDESGFGRISLFGVEQQPQIVLYRDEVGNGGLSVHNAAGALVDYLGADVEGNGGLRIENADGTRVFYMGDDLRGNGVIEASAKGGGRLRD